MLQRGKKYIKGVCMLSILHKRRLKKGKETCSIPEVQGSVHQSLPDQSTITAQSQWVRTPALGEKMK